jgi:uncharacterized membrane protein YjjP (DUF1212 family)
VQTEDVDASKATDLLEFMLRLAQAQIACGEQTARIELALRRIAAAYGMRKSRVVVFPTAIFVTLHDGIRERVTLAEGPMYSLRLDQIADVYALTRSAESGELVLQQGLDRLAEVLRRQARFGPVGTIAGHAVLTLGLAMILKPSLENLAAAALLGALVGALKLANRERPVLAVPTPVVAAALVSALVFLAMNRGFAVDPAHMLVPPLVTFLPGAMLTQGMVELAYGEMISGTSRLITGFVQLVLLAFGLAAGAMLVGYSAEELIEAAGMATAIPWGFWGPWAAVIVFGTGVFVHFSAPERSFGWILLVLLVVFTAQQVAAAVFGSEISGFFGMLVATPLGYLIQTRFRGPPAMVTFLPSFWLVVPGSLGLRSVTHLLSDRAAGIDGIVSVIFAITSIALGTLVGASIYKALTEQFGSWQVQIGRVGLWVRHKRRRGEDGDRR